MLQASTPARQKHEVFAVPPGLRSQLMDRFCPFERQEWDPATGKMVATTVEIDSDFGMAQVGNSEMDGSQTYYVVSTSSHDIVQPTEVQKERDLMMPRSIQDPFVVHFSGQPTWNQSLFSEHVVPRQAMPSLQSAQDEG